MKKIFSYLILTAFIAAVILPAGALADMSAVLSLISDAAKPAAPGDEFTVTLHIKGDYEVHAAQIYIDYDPASLEVKSAEKCAFLEKCPFLKPKDKGSELIILDYTKHTAQGRITIACAFPYDGMSGEGDLIRMKFKLKEGAAGQQQITLTVREFTYVPRGETAVSVYCAIENAVIQVGAGSTSSVPANTDEAGTPFPQTTEQPSPQTTGQLSPQTTEQLSPQTTEQPSDAPAESASPESSAAPSADLNSPEPVKPNDSNKKDGKNNKKAIIIYAVLGAVAIAAAAALIVTGVKKNNK